MITIEEVSKSIAELEEENAKLKSRVKASFIYGIELGMVIGVMLTFVSFSLTGVIK